MQPTPFTLEGQLTCFEKSSAPEGRRRRIAGVISTEIKDKQEETVLQDGLDFSYFLSKGYFNDNHGKKTGDVLGYPEKVRKFAKGDRLPDGKLAKSNCTWAEGYLLDTPDADRVWQVAQSLEKAGDNARQLGFSLEGDIQRRVGEGGKTVAKALIRHVAITHCPVGEETSLTALAKAESLVKALTMGDSATGPGTAPATGEGAGAVLAPESLLGNPNHKLAINAKKPDAEDDEQKLVIGHLTKSAAVEYVRTRLSCSPAQATRALNAVLTKEKHMSGKPTISALDAALENLEKSCLATPNRKQELLAKAAAGTATSAETAELAKSLTGGGTTGTSATAAFTTETMQKSVDSSDYLAEHARATIAGFKVLAETIEKSNDGENAFRLGVAKVFKAQNDLIKSLDEKLESFGNGQARPAISTGVPSNGAGGNPTAQPLNKSFDAANGNAGVATETMVKSMDGKEYPAISLRKATATMTDMLIKGGVEKINGQSITLLIAKAESAGEITPAVLGEVAKYAATHPAA